MLSVFRQLVLRTPLVLGGLVCPWGCEEPGPKPVRVLVASSLAAMLESFDFGDEIEISSAASSVLASQLLAGVRADVVLLADRLWMDELQDGGMIVPGSRVEIARNSLVLAVPVAGTQSIAGAIPAGRVAIAEPAVVPLGRYSAEALHELGWWSTVEDRLVHAGEARAVLGLVEAGEVDYAIVYASDAFRSDGIRVEMEIDPDLHRPIVCEGALLVDRPEARGFLAALLQAKGRARLIEHGFQVGSVTPTRVGP